MKGRTRGEGEGQGTLRAAGGAQARLTGLRQGGGDGKASRLGKRGRVNRASRRRGR